MSSRNSHVAVATALRRARQSSDAANQRLKNRAQAAARRKTPGSGRASRNAGSFKLRGVTPTLAYKSFKGEGDEYAEKRAVVSFTNMLSNDSGGRRAEFLAECRQYPGRRPELLVKHCCLSLAGGRNIDASGWKKVVEEFLKNIGADGSYSAHVHGDTAHQHVHIQWSRVRRDGGLVDVGWSYLRHREAAALAADKYLGGREMPRAAGAVSAPSQRVANANRLQVRQARPAQFIEVTRIHAVLNSSTSPKEFAAGLKAAGIDVQPAKRVTDQQVVGLLFRNAGSQTFLAGSSIDRGLSLARVFAALEANRLAALAKQLGNAQHQLLQRQTAIEAQRQQIQFQQVHRPKAR